MHSLLKILSAFTSVNFIRAISPFLLLPLLTHYLSTSDYGTLSLIEASILVLTPLVMFNSNGLLSTRYYKEDFNYIAKLNFNIIFIIFISCAILVIITLPAYYYLASSGISYSAVLFALPLFILLRAINAFQLNLWQTQHKVKLYAAFSIAILFLDLGLSILCVAYLKMGYIGRLIGTNISYVVFTTIGIMLIHKKSLIFLKFEKKIIKEILRYGAPLIPHAIGGVSMAVANRYIVAYFLDQNSVGIYSLGYQVGSIMLLLGTSINQAWSVTLFKWLSAGIVENRKTIQKTIKYLTIATVASAILIIISRDFLFFILSNKKYELAKDIFWYMVISFMFQSLYFIFVNFDFYEEKVKAIGLTTFAVSIAGIVFSCALTPIFGLTGAAAANMVTMMTYFLIVFVRVVFFSQTFKKVWR